MVAPIPAQFRPLSSDRRRASGTQSVKLTPLLLITSLQSQYFHAITHSFVRNGNPLSLGISTACALCPSSRKCTLFSPQILSVPLWQIPRSQQLATSLSSLAVFFAHVFFVFNALPASFAKTLGLGGTPCPVPSPASSRATWTRPTHPTIIAASTRFQVHGRSH
jgi:hypothetical protein